MFRNILSKRALANSKNVTLKNKLNLTTDFIRTTPIISQRSVSTEEEEAYKKNLTREYIEDLISSVLTDEQTEHHTTEDLQRLCTLTTNKQEFIEVLKTSVKQATYLQYLGDHEVGYQIKRKPVRVAVTGAAGNIGYSLIPRIISGEVFGPFQPVILHLIERPDAMTALEGSIMEFKDMAMPLCRGIVGTSDLNEGFKGVDYAFLVGAKPRGKGMERGDLLKENANIFKEQGKAINDNASTNCLTVVVGNPANTNALVAASNAPDVNPMNFTALTRLDQDRAIAQIADQVGVHLSKIDRVSIWGNHSATQYPDITSALIDGKPATEVLDQKWVESTFIPRVQKRGAEIIDARGASSAASAADAAIKHMRDWVQGTSTWVSMAVPSDGSYGIKEGIYCSYPVLCPGSGKYEIVKDLKIDAFSRKKIDASVKELFDERNAVKKLLKN